MQQHTYMCSKAHAEVVVVRLPMSRQQLSKNTLLAMHILQSHTFTIVHFCILQSKNTKYWGNYHKWYIAEEWGTCSFLQHWGFFVHTQNPVNSLVFSKVLPKYVILIFSKNMLGFWRCSDPTLCSAETCLRNRSDGSTSLYLFLSILSVYEILCFFAF